MSANISKLPGSGPYGFQDNAYYEEGTLIMDVLRRLFHSAVELRCLRWCVYQHGVQGLLFYSLYFFPTHYASSHRYHVDRSIHSAMAFMGRSIDWIWEAL